MSEGSGYQPETYGDRIAEIYDRLYGQRPQDAMVDRLAEWAGEGRALELGIGTGRVALPLRERGVRVEGIDASAAMIAVLRAKPGGADLPVHVGDFSAFNLDRRFGLVYAVFNTFFALLSQADQIRCFESVAAHLGDDGVFALELFVPDIARYRDGNQSVRVAEVGLDSVQIDATVHDPVKQLVHSQHLIVIDGEMRLYPVDLRYAWPAELDLMARLAGLERRHRWADWDRSAFGPASTKHISVYGRAGASSDEG